MTPMNPDPAKIREFRTPGAFESWMRRNHDRESEIWLKIHKKNSGLRTISNAEALDVALCWGWLDGIRKSFDDLSYLQRYTPRRPKSVCSQVNRRHVARLIEEGRMTPYGQRHVDAAIADGRWEAAYAPISETTIESIPADLRAAINESPKARKALERIGRADLFALVYRVGAMKTDAGRARKIAELVRLLELKK
jgi:uncharacterized protein YdeI (YjbR/CyaY-like superfamily)